MLTHYKELDGLRGIAILLVVIFHCRLVSGPATEAQLQYFLAVDMGWIGVDLFFALSGFLITRILLNTYKDPQYFRNFYARRISRIFPLYYGVLALVFIGSRLTDGVTSIEQPYLFVEMTYWVHMQNWIDAANHTPILAAFWSLAIEEQFYLAWPFLILVAARSKKLEWLCLGAWGLTILFRYWYVSSGQEGAYFLTLSRLDGLALGALVAVVLKRLGTLEPVRSRAILVASVAALVIIAIKLTLGRFYGHMPQVLLYGLPALAALFSSMIVIAVTGNPDNLLRRFLRAKLLCYFGKISFGMYVFHLAIITAINEAELLNSAGFWFAQFAMLSVVLGATSLLAAISFRYFESPIMQRRPAIKISEKLPLEA